MEFANTIEEKISNADDTGTAAVSALSLIDPKTIPDIDDNNDFKLKKQKLLSNTSSIGCVINSVMSQKDGDDFIEEMKGNKNEFKKARNEYLKIINGTNGYSQIKNIYIDAINTIKMTNDIHNNPTNYYIMIKDDNKQENYFVLSEGEFIIIGRNNECDFISSNIDVSRINNVILKYLNKIYVFDMYSLNRTTISERKNSLGEIVPINDEEQEQCVLKFNENESAKLKIGLNTEIIFSQKECIICFERQRNILFDPCRHCVMCPICVDTYKDDKCPICKMEITNIERKHLCVNTMAT
jgi:hypothetical protein